MNRWFELKGEGSRENEWHKEMYYSIRDSKKLFSTPEKFLI